MYEYKKRPSKIKKVFLFFLLIAMVSTVSIFAYNMYINIDINSKDESQDGFGAIRLTQNISEEEKDEDITDILEKTTKCVVGISKLKNNGNSIFLNNSTQELGLGTGMIITDNRIYFNQLACCR